MQKSKLDHPVFIAALAAAGLLLKPYRPPPHDLAPAKPHPFKRRVAGREQAADSSRGQDADSPTEIPARGWWDVIKRVARDVSENQLMTQAAAITFYALLSFFPALAALVSIYGLIADPATIMKQVDALSGVLPGGGQELLTEELKSLTSASNGGLGWGLIVGLATSLWTSNQAMKALFGALNVVHEEHEKRSFFKLTALTLACTAGVVLFMIVALIGVVVVPAVLNFVGLGGVTEVLIKWLRWPVLLLIVGVLLAALYRYGPSRETAKWRWVSYGSAFAAILWVIVSLLFSWYVANFGNYNKTYGSLGAVVGFMTWIWISAMVILMGAELNAELEEHDFAGEGKGPGAMDAAPEDKIRQAG
jgi:membrane protein